ncbi:hypothetical protein H6501_03345 [Candidatus Woesearchaeota archaeon]|nr:hypothetical protein [Nanoarchaeota archaeon]MCB9370604.1 hypothetical protein [Candidatus Woesearchaeota archaeon]USN43685.1 MAG: hypothetical protein H6500_04830 [Candidatus Woesearchaeota archaeon]
MLTKEKLEEKVAETNRRIPIVFNEHIANRVADFFIDTKSYIIDLEKNPEEYFLWKSGIRAPFYCNCRNITSNPRVTSRISDYLAEVVEDGFPEVDSIVSLATAGIGWGSRVSEKLGLPFGYIRSAVKEHGIKKYCEGITQSSKNVVIIDDLVAEGGSIKNSIENLNNEFDTNILGVLSLINWNFKKMYQNLSNNVGKIYSLTSYPHLLNSAMRRNLITEEEVEQLEHFYQNPTKEFSFNSLKRK